MNFSQNVCLRLTASGTSTDDIEIHLNCVRDTVKVLNILTKHLFKNVKGFGERCLFQLKEIVLKVNFTLSVKRYLSSKS